MRNFFLLLISLMYLPTATADNATWNKLEQALASDIRSAEEKNRDTNRKPMETLKFIGLRDDMQVLELFPGTGWYTKLLAPVLRDKGQLYAAMMTNRLQPLIETHPTLNKVKILDINPDMPMTEIRGIFELETLSFFIDNRVNTAGFERIKYSVV